jgi:hypothetical protein
LLCPSHLIFDLFSLLYGEQHNHEASNRQFFSPYLISVLSSSAPHYPTPSVYALIWMWQTKYRTHAKLQVKCYCGFDVQEPRCSGFQLPARCPYGKLGFRWPDFHDILYVNIFWKSVKKMQVSLKSDKNNGYLTWRPTCIFDHISQYSS